MFIVVFVIVFVVLDVLYSLRDISYWGMIPALSSSSQERSVYTALGTFTGSIGYNGVTAIVVPVVGFFGALAGAGSESQEGWTGFGAVIAILGIVTCLAVAFGTREEESVLRDPSDKSNPLQAFQAIARNDQLLWASLSYVLYSIANVATTGFMIYLFKFVLRLPDSYSVVGIIAFVIGLVVTPPVPGDQPPRAAPLPLPRRYGAHGHRLRPVHPLLHEPHGRLHRAGALLPACHVHPDDCDPHYHGLG